MTASGHDEFPLAGNFERVRAAVIDGVLVLCIFTLLFKIAYLLKETSDGAFLINLTVFLTYFVDTSCRRWSATPGQMMLSLKVVDAQYGRPLTHNRALARAVITFLPLTPFVYYYYVIYPGILIDQHEFRAGSGKLWQKIKSGEVLTAVEQKRWHDFQVYVQQPVNEAFYLSLKMTAFALCAYLVVMLVHRKHKSIQDMLTETMVIDTGKRRRKRK